MAVGTIGIGAKLTIRFAHQEEEKNHEKMLWPKLPAKCDYKYEDLKK